MRGTASTFRQTPPHVFLERGQVRHGGNNITKGTAIATFVDGKYQSLSTGNHAAFFISKDANGITIMDQWFGSKKKTIFSRHIPRKGKLQSGRFADPSNSADAYSIIE